MACAQGITAHLATPSSHQQLPPSQAGAASPSGQGNDSDDGLGATDAEMFRMDAKLAAYFATIKNGKGGTPRQLQSSWTSSSFGSSRYWSTS